MSPGRHASHRAARDAAKAAGAPVGFAKMRARVALWWRRLDTRGRILSAGAGTFVVLALLGGALAAVAVSGETHTPPPPAHHNTVQPHTVVSTSTIPKRHVDSHLCPLTGTLAPGGKVPQRPAEGVKIGNDPASRPQSGLPYADIVYEEMAEGGITRYLAIFQCQAAPAIGPTRSVRWDDWHILPSYGHPILAFSGGIDQWDTVVAQQSWLFDANGSFYPTANAYYRTSDRVPPWNYYTSSAALWALDKNHKPPPPQFTFTKAVPRWATPASEITIDSFAAGESVVWTWSKSANAWMRFYGSQPDVDASGAQLHAANVVVEYVHTQPGPYAESGNVPDTESITEGSGPVYILRNGKVETGTWSCPAYGDLTTFHFANGKSMTFQPGNTWVELVPYSYSHQLTP